jgi:hypothetical protein
MGIQLFKFAYAISVANMRVHHTNMVHGHYLGIGGGGGNSRPGTFAPGCPSVTVA